MLEGPFRRGKMQRHRRGNATRNGVIFTFCPSLCRPDPKIAVNIRRERKEMWEMCFLPRWASERTRQAGKQGGCPFWGEALWAAIHTLQHWLRRVTIGRKKAKKKSVMLLSNIRLWMIAVKCAKEPLGNCSMMLRKCGGRKSFHLFEVHKIRW